MDYEIKLADFAQEQLEDIERYITDVLKSPSAALNTVFKILDDLELLKSQHYLGTNFESVTGVRLSDEVEYYRLVIENYYVLYVVNDLEKRIEVDFIYNSLQDYTHIRPIRK